MTAAWRKVPCDKCGSPAGQRCRRRTFDGYVSATNAHAQRVALGKAAAGDKRRKSVRDEQARFPKHFIRMGI